MAIALVASEPAYDEPIGRPIVIGPTRREEPIPMRPDPGPKGNWDKCVARREKKLASRKRQRQARKKQQRSK